MNHIGCNQTQRAISISSHLLHPLTLFHELSIDERHTIQALMRPCDFRVGDLMVRQGEYSNVVFLLKEGSVKVMRSNTGNETRKKNQSNSIVFSVLGSNSIIGELHAWDGEAHSFSIEVLEPVCAWALSIDDFRRCVQEIPKFNQAFLSHLASLIRFQARRQEILALHNVGGAIASQLLLFADQCGEVQDKGWDKGTIFLPLPLTQTLLAELTGHSRESVNKVFKRFIEANYIQTQPGYRLLLTDTEALQRVYLQAVPHR